MAKLVDFDVAQTNLEGSLGIKQERGIELMKLCKNTARDQTLNTAEAIKKLLDACGTTEELVYCMLFVGMDAGYGACAAEKARKDLKAMTPKDLEKLLERIQKEEI